jgi:hypothetical protein
MAQILTMKQQQLKLKDKRQTNADKRRQRAKWWFGNMRNIVNSTPEYSPKKS